MLPIKKLYIDTRFKAPDSVSDSDFYIDLPQTLTMPEGTGFYLDDISIPVSWHPIEKIGTTSYTLSSTILLTYTA